ADITRWCDFAHQGVFFTLLRGQLIEYAVETVDKDGRANCPPLIPKYLLNHLWSIPRCPLWYRPCFLAWREDCRKQVPASSSFSFLFPVAPNFWAGTATG